MAIISQETWDNMSEESKEKIIKKYNWYQEKEVKEAILEFENLFGKENLQVKPKIRTWCDVAIYRSDLWDNINKLNSEIANCPYIDDKLFNKLIATIQIQKLIELAYGGMITEEEWRNDTVGKYSIEWDEEDNCPIINYHCSRNWSDFISFHTKHQAEAFISYQENVELIKRYHLMSY